MIGQAVTTGFHKEQLALTIRSSSLNFGIGVALCREL